MPEFGELIGSQIVLKALGVTLDKNGKIIVEKTEYEKALEFVSGFTTGDPGGAADLELVEIEIPAGQILELYHITCTSETGAKGFQIATTTATFAAPLSGVAGYTPLWGALITGTQIIADQSKEPFLVIDNSEGSAILYVNLYGITGFMDVVQANTEDLAGFMSGYMYTP